MDTETVQLFVGLLTIAAAVGAITVVVLRLLAAAGNEGAARLGSTISDSGVWLAWIVALGATLGSLYFSEVANFSPCRLCWFQRIGMYPLAAILVVAAIRRDWGVKPYALTLAIGGPVISLYHVLVEHYPWLEKGVACDPFNPCSVNPIQGYDILATGFMKSIPYMALSGFLLVATILVVARKPDDESAEGAWNDGPTAQEER